MNANIKDVAKAAGVSIASVSRVLSGSPGVSEETAVRIRKVIEEMDYRPNLGARGLVKRQTGNIAVALPKGTSFILGNPFFTRVIEGIASTLDDTHYNMVLSFTAQQQKRILESRAVDGILLFAPRTNELTLEFIEQSGSKTVLIGSYLENTLVPCVRPDDFGGVAKAVEQLHQLGHRRIALVNGPSNSLKSQRCLEGYKEGLRRTGLRFHPEDVMQAGEFEAMKAKEAMYEYLDSGGPATGVVCSSDYLAMGVVKAASERKLSIPQDLSVVGFGDIPFAEFFIPSLSTVAVDLVGMGRQAATLLLDLLQGKQIRKKERIFKMDYVARDTCAPPKA